MRIFLEETPLQIRSLADLPPIQTCPETGETFLENARSKSLYYSQNWEGLTLAEDSGLVVDCLQGAPGVHSARFSGPKATDARNIKKLLRLLEGIAYENRQARFVSTMVVSLAGRVLTEIEEQVSGVIASEPRGSQGFGYDPVFFYPPLQKTFAQLDPQEKNRISHRGRALEKLKLFLEQFLSPSL
jgi:XTP/dITP diphosphohydrolase